MTDIIFDAFEKTSQLIHLQDALIEKQEQLNSVESKRCGNCFDWMKSSCIPEKKYKQFKSCNSFACQNFRIDPSSIRLANSFKKELKDIENMISQVKG